MQQPIKRIRGCENKMNQRIDFAAWRVNVPKAAHNVNPALKVATRSNAGGKTIHKLKTQFVNST